MFFLQNIKDKFFQGFSTFLLLSCLNWFEIVIIASPTFNITEFSDESVIEIKTGEISFYTTHEGDSIPILDQATYLYQKGAPELLKLVRPIVRDYSFDANWELISSEYTDYIANIAPSAGFILQNQTKIVREKGPEYQKDQFFPSNLADTFDPVSTGNQWRQVFWFYPMQYNPVTNTLRVYHQLKFKISIKRVGSLKSNVIPQLPKSYFKKMLIITPDVFQKPLQPFIQWKKQLGIDIILVSADSIKTESLIRATVKNFYLNQKIDYLLLVGNHKQVPTSRSQHGPSDYSYGLLAGSDQYADIPIGRFPASTVRELETMVTKSIQYEKSSSSDQWLKSYLGAASNENGNNSGDKGESDYEHISNLAKLFSKNGFSSQIVLQGSKSNIPISSHINQGSHMVFYTGHGDVFSWTSTKFNTDSVVSNLHNFGKYPIVIDAACLNGNIEIPGSLAEAFLKAEKDSLPTGAVAMLASSITQLWAPPMLGQDLIAEKLFDSKYSNNPIIGNLSFDSFYEIIDHYGLGGTETVYTWLLFGDPSLRLFTKTPVPMNCIIPDKFDIAQDTFLVHGPDSAIVTMTCQNELIDTKLIANGVAKLIKSTNQFADSVTFTFSKSNFEVFQKKLEPFSDGSSYYLMNKVIVSDLNNQIPENFEWISLRPIIKNHGKIAGQSIQVVLSSENSEIEIKNSKIGKEIIKEFSQDTFPAFEFRTKSQISDGSELAFKVLISDKNGQTNASQFLITINAPVLEKPLLVFNKQTNVKIGSLIANTDEVEVGVSINNIGNADYKGLKVKINSNDALINIISSFESTSDILKKSNQLILFRLKLNENAPIGQLIKGTIQPDGFHEVPFEFYYHNIPRLIVGDSSRVEDEFPFYNYYKSNKSQFIYSSHDLLFKSRIIDSIGFNLYSVSNSTNNRNFKNFSLSIGYTKESEFTNSFTSSDSLVQVYSNVTMTLPAKSGWVFFDIVDFHYNGSDNLLVEVNWGMNQYSTNYNGSFSVYSHQSTTNTTAYGFSDQLAPSKFTGVSKLRPDIIFCEKTATAYNVQFKLISNNFSLSDTVWIQIGEKIFELNTLSSYTIFLPKGTYQYQVFLKNSLASIQSGQFEVKNESVDVPIELIMRTKVVENKDPKPKFIFNNHVVEIYDLCCGSNNISIFNTNGVMVYNQNTFQNNKVLNIQNLNKGLYFVVVQNNRSKYIFKLIR